MVRRERHADRVNAAVTSGAAAGSSLAASWRRSSALGISRATLHRKLKREADLKAH